MLLHGRPIVGIAFAGFVVAVFPVVVVGAIAAIAEFGIGTVALADGRRGSLCILTIRKQKFPIREFFVNSAKAVMAAYDAGSSARAAVLP